MSPCTARAVLYIDLMSNAETYVTGRALPNAPAYLLMCTKDMTVATSYAGRRGEIWECTVTGEVMDLSGEGPARSVIVAAVESAIESGRLADDMTADCFWPEDLVNSAEAFDDPDCVEWFCDDIGYGFDWVLLPNDCAICINPAKAQYKVIK